MTGTTAHERRSPWRLPLVFLAGPLAWGVELVVGYLLVSIACGIGSKWPVYALTGVTALIVLAAGYLAFRTWRVQGGRADIADVDKPQGTRTFIAMSGALLSMLFFVLILVTGVTSIFFSPCPIITMPLP